MIHAEAEAFLSRRCPVMRRLIRAHGPCALVPRKRSPYEALISAVAHQQLHANAAEAILRRFKALWPGTRFPRPAQVLDAPDEALRSCGLSAAKMLAIRDIAAKTQSGLIPPRAAALRLEDEELIQRLVEVRGVGRWTVEMLLIFTLGRPDVFPSDDFGVRNGWRVVKHLDDLPRPGELRQHAERWAPHRTLAAWYLWRAADAAK
ncbi:MAG: DNA-3-methyladenine glycosylase 2 family protein [Verrucomicrobiaceae bacterium]|jgi:DNA-3-methyladenine glycosylase II|nr:DNA-3-methyladenine glycosylase 2 family protein [Verrucomicrobiaceae bacterium]